MKIVASVEARMGSSRMPGKVLMDVFGKPAIQHLFDRLRAAEMLDDMVLATTTSPADDALEAWAYRYGVHVFRGSEEDVLDRVVRAQAMMEADIIVEVTGDCPLLDPAVVDLGVETFLANDCDVVTNVRLPSYPEGVDVQVFYFDALKKMADTIDDAAVREHVSLYFYENPKIYRVINLVAPKVWRMPGQRLQLDYLEDLELIRTLYARLEPRLGPLFGLTDLVALLNKEPSLRDINAHCEEKPVR